MATILLQAAGAALGSVFGPVGAMLGRVAGALAGSVVDRALIGGTTVSGARLSDARIPGAEEGTAITRAYGTVRIGGTLIWATRFEEEVRSERQGGKASGPRVETFRYFANFALGICEGKIAGIRRVWADGRELDLNTVEMRVYRGTEGQPVDPLIDAKQKEAPAFRGLAYAVFERLPLDGFGNRIPVIQFEVLRPVGQLEKDIKAITIIPGATEHGYDPGVVTEKTGAGKSRRINRNVFHGESDWQASIDELQALCPSLERVALVVSWFGTDLRAGECKIVPGVETGLRQAESRPWSVLGTSRGAARIVSRNGGGPAYGGTPSDSSVVAAIADLKARGLEVYLYPFVMMDIADGNALPNPYGGIGQAAYPWRGRITCHPAQGEAGTADGTSAARGQIADFCGTASAGDFTVSGTRVLGGGEDEGYRRLMLHYALLAQAAGGVDGFIIGSELRGLTRLRDGDGQFPFVEQLVALAGDVRAIVGAGTKITYAADWSEYFGYQPADGTGDVHYHLDPLWASDDIDAVGIDNYMPLSDWRDGDLWDGNPDGFSHGADGGAMREMIAGGEGFDWYYQDEADRRARLRTTISDGLAGKPWVYRYKDLQSWWSNVHRDRIGGVEQAEASPWVPGSKPIWFTELGCPAIDKGSNQPNVFVDPKSSENAAPYFSGGGRNDLVQRRFLEAHHAHWTETGGAVDPDRLFVWTWDARPLPAFPENTDLWADGGNWRTGHWLNGRLGAANAGDVIRAVLADHGFDDADTSDVTGDVAGYVQAEQASARDVLEPLMQALSIDAVEDGGRLRFRSRLKLAAQTQLIDVLAEDGEAALYEETRGHGSDFAGEALIDFFDATADYGRATVRSRRAGVENERVLRLSPPAVLHEDMATGVVEDALKDHQAGRRQVRFSLSPAALALEPGDVVTLDAVTPDGGPAGSFIIERIEDGRVRRVEARAFQPSGNGGGTGAVRRGARASRTASDAFSPVVMLMDLAQYDGGEAASFARAAVFARPWRTATLSSSATTEGYRFRQRFERPAKTGTLAATLGTGVAGRFDWSQAVLVNLDFGGLSSASRVSVLNGQNRVAVQGENGVWEIIGFLAAEEVDDGQWKLTGLLRGLHGTGDAMGTGSGANVVVLDEAVKPVGLGSDEAGRMLNVIVEAAGEAVYGPLAFAGGMRAQTPVAPVHLKAERQPGGDIRLSWIRCARRDADHWLEGDIALDEAEERYRIEILDGDAVMRSAESSEPFFVYAAANEVADFGGVQSALSVRVRQRGGKVALGVAAQAVLAV